MLMLVLTMIEIFSAIENSFQYGAEDLMVNLTNGQIRGSVVMSDAGREFLAFRGLPFAEPPTKDLRFQAPVAKKKWDGILDADHDGQVCTQYSLMYQQYAGEEDCLFLNVYTPANRSSSSQLLPVIFFLHGGAFIMGQGGLSEVGIEKFMDYDVVFVTINYRLGPMGFLSSKDSASPGNYALLDQVLALQWVRDNIEKFGGDPKKVTITGTSAGAWGVMLHMVSPLSQGLFHGAIAQSGCPFGNWGNSMDSTQTVHVLGKLLRCEEGSNQEIVDCLRRRSAIEIVQQNNGIDDFTGVIAKVRYHAEADPVRGKLAFLPEAPAKLLDSGRTVSKVPLFIGVTSDDGSFIFDAASYTYNSTGSDHLHNLLPGMMRQMLGLSEENSLKLKDAIVQEYFSDNPTDDIEIDKRLSKIYTDIAFSYCTDQTVEKLSSFGIPVYVYRFTHSRGAFDFLGFNLTYPYKENVHVNHGEDYTYFFNVHKMPQHDQWYNFNDDDKKVSKTLLQLWTTFAKNQVPSSDTMTFPWIPSTPKEPVYLNINKDPAMENGQLCPHTAFWVKNMDELNAKQ